MRSASIILILITSNLAFLAQQPGKKVAFDMSEPIACRTIKGYEEYEPLDEPVIARTEKLMIYTRPSGHAIVEKGGGYHAHLVQDVNVRRKGQKKVLWGRKKIVEYEVTEEYPPVNLYLGTSLGLINFEPGEYEADLILHDKNSESPPARRTLSFRLIEPKPTRSDASDRDPSVKDSPPPRSLCP